MSMQLSPSEPANWRAAVPPETSAPRVRMRFITATPLNVAGGSGTFVGIKTLAAALRDAGVIVDILTPRFRLPIFTLQRLIFNQTLNRSMQDRYDVTVGFDMDGCTLAGLGPSLHAASIKGVIADEMRFESGVTRATMQLQAACERRHVRSADIVLTTSRYSSMRIRELYGLSTACRVVPEPIDLRQWRRLLRLARPRPETAKFVVLSVCRFYRRKRLDVLLKAAARLRRTIPELEVRIVGNGPQAHRLRTLHREKELDGTVVWLNEIPQLELAQEYNCCDIFCLPSVQEGFGIVFLEAMAAGKPIVAARAGAAPEVVENGLLAEPESEEALAEAIERLHRDHLLRKSLADSGTRAVEQFDAPHVARTFLRSVDVC